MTQSEGFVKLFDIIKNNTEHTWYKHVCDLADEYFSLSTGVGLNDKLRQFASRESVEAFSERKKITLQICSSIVSNLTNIFYRIPRSNGVKVKYKVDDSKKTEFDKLLNNFGLLGFKQYTDQKLKDNIELDPNKWVVIEFPATDGNEYTQPYPYEVSSQQAIMYEYANTDLIYLVDKKPIKLKNKSGILIDTFRYTIYTEQGAVIIEKQPEDMGYFILTSTEFLSEIPEQFNIGTSSYTVIIPEPYNLGFVPARRVGYSIDKITNGETFVNMYDVIRPFLMKMLKVNSELDITMSKHAHMQKIQYQRKCTKDTCHVCDDGKYRVDYVGDNNEISERLCTSCNGKGWTDITTGGLEYIYLPFPETKDDILDLNNIVKYIQVPVEVAQLQNTYIDWLIEMCSKLMFGEEVYKGVTVTATEKTIDTEKKYDSLYPYAINYVSFYSFVLNSISAIDDIPVSINSNVNKDFKLLTKAELIDLIGKATVNGASYNVIKQLNDELIFAFTGESVEFDKYILANKLIPFQNKNREQQMLVMSQLDKTNPYYVSFMFGQDIINKLENDNEDFWLLTFERQKALFDAEILVIAESLKTSPIPYPDLLPKNDYLPA